MNDETVKGLREMDIDSLLEEFEYEIINRGKDYYYEGRVSRLQELTPGKFKAFVAGTQSYNVTIELCPNGDTAYDCDCPYWNAPYCKHVAAALFAIAAGEYETETDSQALEDNLDPLSEEALGALSARRLAKLLVKVVRDYPETENWLRAELSERKHDIRAYKDLIIDSITSQMEHGFVPYNRIYDALRGAWTAVGHLDELSREVDYAHTLEFAVMIITEVSKLSECSDDDGDVSGVIARCMNWYEAMYENSIRQQSETVQTEFFHCLIEWTHSSEMEDWWMPDTEPIEICARIADTIPALRSEVMKFYSDKMDVAAKESDRIWEYGSENAQSAYHSLLLRWDGEEAALQFAHMHLSNDRLCVYLFENMLEKERYTEALALCGQAEGRAAQRSHLHTVTEWKQRRYELNQRMGDETEQRALGEELLLSGETKYYKKLEGLYTAQQWRQKRQELLEALKNGSYSSTAYITVITDDGDKPRILDCVRESPDRILTMHHYLLPEYTDEVKELFYAVLKHNAELVSDRKGYHGVCWQVYAYYQACGIANATSIIEELKIAYPRRRAFQDELSNILERIKGDNKNERK